MIDRETVRSRPAGTPIMKQRWSNLLFLHWRAEAAAVQALLPPGLRVDTYEGFAWIGVTPFTLSGIRPPLLPAIPLVSRSHELNVRTYVVADGVPGVWFFSLDASNPLAVAGARIAFGLPYFLARMELTRSGDDVSFRSRRMATASAPELRAQWILGEALGEAEPGTLESFLVERYCLYTVRVGRTFRCRIHHHPWQLRRARLVSLRNTMLVAQRLPDGERDPLVHAQGAALDVGVWPPERIGTP